MDRALYCIARTSAQAERIITELKQVGFLGDDISVLLADKGGTRDFAHEHNTKAPEGAVAGGVAGMGAGAVLGWLAGIGTLTIPGVGPFLAAGPVMAALSAAAVGTAAGGVIGALAGVGIPEYEAKLFEGKLRAGNILISAHTEDSKQRRRAREIFQAAGAENIASAAEATV
ncbi:MAG TPA: hypothetical protein VGN52_01585 [Burkholderiales bacterium]|jgi:hypothetical protein